MDVVRKLVSKTLHLLADQIEKKEVCNDEDIENAITLLADINLSGQMSKYQACQYLNISRSSFDSYVKDGKLPKGRKVVGFKELFWNKAELDNYLKHFENN